MNKNIKRVLAMSAIAPIAFIGSVGSATAALGDPLVVKDGNKVFAFCSHPDVDGLYFEARVALEGDGTGSNANDVESTRVTATDNGGSGEFDVDGVRALSMNVKYFSEDDLADDIDPSARYQKTADGKDVEGDGRKTFGREKDNVDYVQVKVVWKVDGDKETLVCGFETDEELA